MKGWVYVITNKAMPGLAKIGFSTKDPELRADDLLRHTGIPHPYEVDYEVLIKEPYQLEQQVHEFLSSKREGGEWFRCNVEEAISAIRQCAEDRIILEICKRVEHEKVKSLRDKIKLKSDTIQFSFDGRAVVVCNKCGKRIQGDREYSPFREIKCPYCNTTIELQRRI